MNNFLYDLISNIVTIFVVLNPVAVIPFFQGLTANGTQAQRRMIVNRTAVVVVVILLFFALIGDGVLTLLGITLHYIMIAGGIYILVFAVKSAVSAGGEQLGDQLGPKRRVGLTNAVAEKIAIVPIGTPLLAGPGTIATAMILNDAPSGVTVTVIAIIVNVLLAWLILRLSSRLLRVVSPSILMILSTVMNILMATIGVAFLLKGLSAAYGIKFI